MGMSDPPLFGARCPFRHIAARCHWACTSGQRMGVGEEPPPLPASWSVKVTWL